MQGLVRNRAGRLEEAVRLFQRAAVLCRKVGEKAGLATSLSNLGGLYVGLGQPSLAITILTEGMAVAVDTGVAAATKADLCYGLARAYQQTGNVNEALRFFARAADSYRRLNLPAADARVASDHGNALASVGRWDAAEDCWTRAEAALQRLHAVDPIAARRMRAMITVERPERPTV